jgi:hypothetical protein
MSKFAQEFKSAEILQLRINHNFTHIDLPESKIKNLTIIELEFNEESFGSITLAYNKSKGPLKVFLYREEKANVMKLVGQAK